MSAYSQSPSEPAAPCPASANTAVTVMPAEWEPQDAVLLVWPPDPMYWESTIPLAEVEAVFAHLATAISRFQRVVLVVPPADPARVETALAAAALTAGPGVDLTRIQRIALPANDVWARDLGPLTVRRDGQAVLLDYIFNGWGTKYPADRDTLVSRRLHGLGVFGTTPIETIPFVLEGGSLDSDGEGSILTTSPCLLTPTRNPHLDRAAIDAKLRQDFGAARILWLDHGDIVGDDTDGHIDMLARFAPGHVILHAACHDPADPHFAPLAAMTAELRAMRTLDGAHYRLVELPVPVARHDRDGRRLPASYANFLVINGAVLVPTYRDPAADATALAAIAAAFPGRDVVGLDCVPLIHQFGSLHCVTMQLPEGTLA